MFYFRFYSLWSENTLHMTWISSFSSLSLFSFLNWSIADLHVMLVSGAQHTDAVTHAHASLQVLWSHRLLQNIGYSFLCYTTGIGPCRLSILYIVVFTHWERLWCWEGLGAGGKGDDRGWDGWMASLTRWRWVWVNSGSWWWTGRLGVLRFMGSQRVRHDWVTELNWTDTLIPSSVAPEAPSCCTFFSPPLRSSYIYYICHVQVSSCGKWSEFTPFLLLEQCQKKVCLLHLSGWEILKYSFTTWF